MRAIKEAPKKRHFYILLNGSYLGETWAVSEAKAINNVWWKKIKEEDYYHIRDCEPDDLEAVEV